jgi:hypothetical protein
VLKGSVVSTFRLPKRLNEISLIPPEIEKVSTPVRAPEKEHACIALKNISLKIERLHITTANLFGTFPRRNKNLQPTYNLV